MDNIVSYLDMYVYMMAHCNERGEVKKNLQIIRWECGWNKEKMSQFQQWLIRGQLVDQSFSGIKFINPIPISIKKQARQKQKTLMKDCDPGPNRTESESIAIWMWRLLVKSWPGESVLMKANMETWEKDCRDLIDRHRAIWVRAVFEYALKDKFWSGVIMSPASLNKNFSKIASKVSVIENFYTPKQTLTTG